VDRQRNDRLGRIGRRQCFEHRRQILRRCSGSDTHANIFSDPNCDSYAHGNCNGNGNSDSDADPNPMHGEMCTHAEAAPDSGTSTVMDAGLATERFCPNVHFGDCAMNCAAADAQFFCGGLPAHSPEQRVLATATKL
jgi:hypothetical protein